LSRAGPAGRTPKISESGDPPYIISVALGGGGICSPIIIPIIFYHFKKGGGGLDAVEGGILLASVGDGRLKGRGGGRGER